MNGFAERRVEARRARGQPAVRPGRAKSDTHCAKMGCRLDHRPLRAVLETLSGLLMLDVLLPLADGREPEITGYVGPGGAVVISDHLGGRPVASIGNAAFSGVSNLTHVTLLWLCSTDHYRSGRPQSDDERRQSHLVMPQ
jgi:hypothetical protein